MGFNIGVSSLSTDFKVNLECFRFIERMFYIWVDEYDNYGDQSCIIKTGEYFGLDLIPLTKLIYTNDEVDEEYIKSGLQQTDFLIQLVNSLIQNVMNEPNFIDKLDYALYSDEKEVYRDTNTWKEYLVEGEFLEHLNTLKDYLICYKSKGQDEVFLTAG